MRRARVAGRSVRSVRLVALLAAVTAVATIGGGCSASATAPVERQAAGVPDPGSNDPSLLQLDDVVDMRGQAAITVEVDDNTFAPKEIKVSPGTKITWTNKGFNAHNVTPVAAGQFDAVPTGGLDPGASADRTLATPGVYRYYCTIHGSPTKGQRAAIVVQG
jgi:plastocyanin